MVNQVAVFIAPPVLIVWVYWLVIPQLADIMVKASLIAAFRLASNRSLKLGKTYPRYKVWQNQPIPLPLYAEELQRIDSLWRCGNAPIKSSDYIAVPDYFPAYVGRPIHVSIDLTTIC